MSTPAGTSGGGGGIGQAAKELLQEMQQAQAENQPAGKTAGGGQAFEATLHNQQVQASNAAQEVATAAQVREAHKATGVLLQARNSADLPPTTVGAAAKAERSRLGNMLQNLIRGQDRMNEIMEMALSGRSFSPPELIAMQAGVYRFTQELELTSKVVEKATSGIKQTMNTQV